MIVTTATKKRGTRSAERGAENGPAEARGQASGEGRKPGRKAPGDSDLNAIHGDAGDWIGLFAGREAAADAPSGGLDRVAGEIPLGKTSRCQCSFVIERDDAGNWRYNSDFRRWDRGTTDARSGMTVYRTPEHAMIGVADHYLAWGGADLPPSVVSAVKAWRQNAEQKMRSPARGKLAPRPNLFETSKVDLDAPIEIPGLEEPCRAAVTNDALIGASDELVKWPGWNEESRQACQKWRNGLLGQRAYQAWADEELGKANGNAPATIEPHPYAEIFPRMGAVELAELSVDIRERGLDEPIVLYQGKILDGRNRFAALAEQPPNLSQVLSGAHPQFRSFTGSDAEALAFVLARNKLRRHLDKNQLSIVAARIAELRPGGRPKKAAAKTATAVAVSRPSLKEAAKSVGVSTRSAQRAAKVIEKGIPAIAEAVEAGKLSVTRAQHVAELPRHQQLAELKSATAAGVGKKWAEQRQSKPKPEAVSRELTGVARVRRLTLNTTADDREHLDTIERACRFGSSTSIVKAAIDLMAGVVELEQIGKVQLTIRHHRAMSRGAAAALASGEGRKPGRKAPGKSATAKKGAKK